MLVGEARVSTLHQDPALQPKALRAAGREGVFVKAASCVQHVATRTGVASSKLYQHFRGGISGLERTV
jgi:hypothetical protein